MTSVREAWGNFWPFKGTKITNKGRCFGLAFKTSLAIASAQHGEHKREEGKLMGVNYNYGR